MSRAQLLREQARRYRELAMSGSGTPAPHLLTWAMEFDAKAANAQALESAGQMPLADTKAQSRRAHRVSRN
jgi:hypothetical protein